MTPLAGVRVLDLSQVIAGPYGSALLTTAGAKVIKVEPVQGEIWRGLGASFLALNRGKQSLPLNLRDSAGRDVLYRLAERSDVLIENYRPGVTERLGIDYATLSRINPRLIYYSITAFGSDGPYAHRPGFDPLLQAMTGIERAQGGAGNPAVFLRIAICDYATALLQAAAIPMALFNRARTGEGAHISTSLLRAGIFVNAGAFTRYTGRPAAFLPDAGQNGLGPLDRMYATKTAWLFIHPGERDDDWRRLVSLPLIAPLASDDRFRTPADRVANAEALAAALEGIFATDTAEAWLEALEAANVPSAPVVEGYDKAFFADVQPIVNQYAVRGQHAELGRVEHPGNFIHYSGSPSEPEGRSSPVLGEDTDAILRDLGIGAADIAACRERGVTK